jgi:hypothetical protein
MHLNPYESPADCREIGALPRVGIAGSTARESGRWLVGVVAIALSLVVVLGLLSMALVIREPGWTWRHHAYVPWDALATFLLCHALRGYPKIGLVVSRIAGTY